ncbi:hypothetical protein SERMPA_00023 (plasmid) [Serratia marcescens]
MKLDEETQKRLRRYRRSSMKIVCNMDYPR